MYRVSPDFKGLWILGVETMELGGLSGLTALTMGLGQDHAKQIKEVEVENNNGDKQLITA